MCFSALLSCRAAKKVAKKRQTPPSLVPEAEMKNTLKKHVLQHVIEKYFKNQLIKKCYARGDLGWLGVEKVHTNKERVPGVGDVGFMLIRGLG